MFQILLICVFFPLLDNFCRILLVEDKDLQILNDYEEVKQTTLTIHYIKDIAMCSTFQTHFHISFMSVLPKACPLTRNVQVQPV